MKRKIIYSFIFIAVSMFMMVGCGSNSKENPIAPPNNGPYSFFNATTPVIITEGSGTNEASEPVDSNNTLISVQLLKNGLVEPGELVQMKPFDYKYGTIVDMAVVTDENGNAIFEYIAPSGGDYNAIRGQDVTIQAILLDPNDDVDNGDDAPNIILTQDFVLQFR